MMGYSTILAAIPGFFISSLIFMALAVAIAPDLDIHKIGYPIVMMVTITLWLVVAPLMAAGRKKVAIELLVNRNHSHYDEAGL